MFWLYCQQLRCVVESHSSHRLYATCPTPNGISWTEIISHYFPSQLLMRAETSHSSSSIFAGIVTHCRWGWCSRVGGSQPQPRRPPASAAPHTGSGGWPSGGNIQLDSPREEEEGAQINHDPSNAHEPLWRKAGRGNCVWVQITGVGLLVVCGGGVHRLGLSELSDLIKARGPKIEQTRAYSDVSIA